MTESGTYFMIEAMTLTSTAVEKELKKLGTKERAKANAWFFKSGKGEYGEGDEFVGVAVPQMRKVAKTYADLPLGQIKLLLWSPIHECRLTALFILVKQFQRGEKKEKREIVSFYLKNRERVNNWDLVDSSASYILGTYLLDKNRKPLYKLARAKSLWDKRIAIIATQAFIREGDFKDTIAISKILLKDEHDLIHKAVGWMLREVGKKNQKTLEAFLDEHAHEMPRTMLRYAIEKFPEGKRKGYLNKKPA